MRKERGLKKIGVATLVVGLALGIIVPFAQFGGVFPVPWVVGVTVIPVLWAAVWAYLARLRTWWFVVLGQWLSLSAACWLFLGANTDWAPQAILGGLIFGSIILVIWMVPVAIVAVLPARR